MDTREPIHIRVVGDVIVDRHSYDSGQGVFEKDELGGAVGLYRLLDALLKAKEVARKAKEEKEKKEQERKEKEEQERKEKETSAESKPAAPGLKVAGAASAGSASATETKASAAGAKDGSADPKKSPPKPVTVALGFIEPRISDMPQSRHAYAVWKPHGRASKDDKTKVWRAAPMGYGRTGQLNLDIFKPRDEPVRPRILVLDDGAAEFRERGMRQLWSLPATGAAKPNWIVFKTSSPLAQGDLWHDLQKGFADRLICIVSAEELRREHAQIGAGMSWERTLEDLSEALESNPALNALNACRHLIVTFSVDGALWVDRVGEKECTAKLFFDPARAEGEWSEPREGKAFGYLSCMTAAIAHAAAEHIAESKRELNLAPAIGTGLGTMRDLLDQGHGLVGRALEETPPRGYPVERLAEILAQEKNDFSIAPIVWPRPAAAAGTWMMISDAPKAPDEARLSVVSGLARQIVIKGHAALRGAAHARFGKLVTADRSEMEGLRGLRQLMLNYRADRNARKPLSIGVFGPPGAGKSFGVEQLAEEVFGPKAWREFNLSQFSGARDLVGAFHQVRDKVLDGLTPVVFWDEFDSQNRSWLRYLLAPMQDGRFQDDQLNHSIGKCVFIFAGGTYFTFDTFGPKPDDKQDEDKFKSDKGPDFKSRLDGYYNVLGPNQRTLPPEWKTPDQTDICYPLRRALIIRFKLADGPDDRLDVDPDLLSALLGAERYSNGARSLEKLVVPLKSQGAAIRRSFLPPPAQLAMHVDAPKFKAILEGNSGFRMRERIESLAIGIHEHWRKGKYPKKEHLDKPYADLDSIYKEDNRAAARRMPDVLALVGLGLVTHEKAKSAKRPSDSQLADYIEAHIEPLAEAEHDGWMEHREKNGWRYHEIRDDDKKLHDAMMPYRKLPNYQKEKDRSSVREYPANANEAGFAIVWL